MVDDYKPLHRDDLHYSEAEALIEEAQALFPGAKVSFAGDLPDTPANNKLQRFITKALEPAAIKRPFWFGMGWDSTAQCLVILGCARDEATLQANMEARVRDDPEAQGVTSYAGINLGQPNLLILGELTAWLRTCEMDTQTKTEIIRDFGQIVGDFFDACHEDA